MIDPDRELRRAARRRTALAAPLLAAASLSAGDADAARVPVLDQVKLPHNYYWRELYLPQLTTGPSSVAFMPSGDKLIYSMDGSLWRQRIDSGDAFEITHADGAYDYQPDVARDGKNVVFVRYDGRAMELWRLDLASGKAEALTSNGGVNVEPRLAPDGRRIVWVSTAGTGHFNLKIADIGPGGLANERFLVRPRESAIDRYYYSSHDHAINPSWTPDGERVYFVGNHEIPWGTGTICSIAITAPDYECVTRHRFETSWAARPEVAPDGKRILFSNYHGGQWHQLWLTTTDDAAPLPLTYGEFDRRNARWSPDGRRIAYVSNEGGNTALYVQELFGGARTQIHPGGIRRLTVAAFLAIRPRDASGNPISARVSVLGRDRRWHAPSGLWMHGDEAYDRSQFPSEVHYFHCPAEIYACIVRVPPGKTAIRVQSGFRRKPALIERDFPAGAFTEVDVRLEDHDLPPGFGVFVSADLHVHMNYGGHYRHTPETLLAQVDAEDLDVIYNLIVNKEERIPDVAYFRPDPDSASGERLLLHAQEYHTSLWGHLGLLHLSEHLLLPDYAAYRHTALESPWPHNGIVANLARAQGALVGYVHPFDFPIDPPKEKSLSYQFPADVAHGNVDYFEVMGFSDHRVTADIWYRLLNLGFRIPAGAGTDAMANYASLRGPVGLVRVFLNIEGERSPAALREALKGGRGFVSNSALLGLEIGGQRPGGRIANAASRLPVRIAMRSPVAIDHLELVHNGRVIRSFELRGDRQSLDWSGPIEVTEGGWMVLRAWNEKAHPDVLDLYPYATTSPIYFDSPRPPPAPADAAYFAAWMDRVIEAARARGGWNDDTERDLTLAYLSIARDRFRALAGSTRKD